MNDIRAVPVRHIRILLADPHSLLREALRAILDGERDLEVVAEVDGGEQAIVDAQRLRPDVAFVAESLSNAIETAAQIRRSVPECSVVVLGDSEDDGLLFEAVLAGSRAYLPNDSIVSDVTETARAVHAGHAVIPARMLSALLDKLVAYREVKVGAAERVARLTRRERQILALLADGAGNEAIAATLLISPLTVRTHIQNLMEKLEVHSRLEAAGLAIYLPSRTVVLQQM